jgi:hypothetical protein
MPALHRPALACMLAPLHAAGDPTKGTWAGSLQPRDLDGDHVADAFYDSGLNLSWLTDANVRGPLPWADAMAWATSLDLHGVTGWRLPTLIQVPTCTPPPFVDCSISVAPGSSELAHMFLTTLGNTPSATPELATWNDGPFTGLQPASYFTDPLGFFGAGFFAAFIFDMGTGEHNIDGDFLPRFAWAVHAGDIAPIPELPSRHMALAGLALCGPLAWPPRRRATGSADSARPPSAVPPGSAHRRSPWRDPSH